MNAAERIAKYPDSHHDPKSDCKFCGGTGERFIKKSDITTCCICIFVDHGWSEQLGTQIGEFARKQVTRK